MSDYKATIGTIISGTHRAQDLIPAFLDELNRLDHPAYVKLRLGFFRAVELGLLEGGKDILEDLKEDNPFWESEDCAHFLNETLFDALDGYAPDFCYFGAHEGDGADFGFWPSIESIEEDEDVLLCSDRYPDGVPVPSYIMFTNDHGNVTLYRVKLEKVWGCV